MNNREAAVFILIGALLLYAALRSKGVRSSYRDVLKSLAPFQILVPLTLFIGSTVAAIWAAAALGFWTTALTSAAILWVMFVGFAWFINIGDAAKDDNFFKRRMIEAVSFAALLEFFMNVQVLSLWAELILQLALFALVALRVVAKTKDEYKPTRKLLNFLLGAIGIALFIYTLVSFISNWQTLDKQLLVNELLMPVWLAATAIASLYPIAFYAAYELLFIALKALNQGRRPSLSAQYGVVRELGGSLVDIAQFRGTHARTAARAHSATEARQAVRDFRHDRQVDLDSRAAATRKLKDFAGVDGVDGNGLLLDRREFDETKAVLQRLGYMHMGWYNNENRPNEYRDDLLDVLNLVESPKFDPAHPIKMKVRADKQAWFAWRTTPSGHVFGVGANGPPPKLWFYDGPNVPMGYPKTGPDWSSSLESDRSEWGVEALHD